MNNIHYLPRNYIEFEGHTIKYPETQLDYARICKRFLSSETYEKIISALYDNDAYHALNVQQQKIVDQFHIFTWKTER